MKKTLPALVALVLAALLWAGLPAAALAHIANEKTQFPDIGTTPQADDIVLLVALNVIPQTPVFEPDATFARKDLAAWAALAHRKDAGGEAPDVTSLVRDGAAYVPSLDGSATASDVNRAIFDGKLQLDNPEATFTRAEAAAFVAAHLSADVLAAWNVSPGPTGRVEKVTTSTSADGDTAYALAIGGRTYPVYDHARVVGPTDLTLWEGHTVSRSYIQKTDDGDALVFVQEQADASESGPAGVVSEQAASEAQPATAATGGTAGTWPWLAGLAVLLAALAILLFRRVRR